LYDAVEGQVADEPAGEEVRAQALAQVTTQ
jgi:hypothetical protein